MSNENISVNAIVEPTTSTIIPVKTYDESGNVLTDGVTASGPDLAINDIKSDGTYWKSDTITNGFHTITFSKAGYYDVTVVVNILSKAPTSYTVATLKKITISSELTRISNAKSAIKSAIEAKGVTVGDGTIDTYAEKIGEISSGGSLPDKIPFSYIFSVYNTDALRVWYNAGLSVMSGANILRSPTSYSSYRFNQFFVDRSRILSNTIKVATSTIVTFSSGIYVAVRLIVLNSDGSSKEYSGGIASGKVSSGKTFTFSNLDLSKCIGICLYFHSEID